MNHEGFKAWWDLRAPIAAEGVERLARVIADGIAMQKKRRMSRTDSALTDDQRAHILQAIIRYCTGVDAVGYPVKLMVAYANVAEDLGCSITTVRNVLRDAGGPEAVMPNLQFARRRSAQNARREAA